jgi:four helix bundle protein
MTNEPDNASPNDRSTQEKHPFDLEERTARFGEAVIAFCKKMPQNPITLPLIGQLVKSGTSVGANYCEADDAVSKKEFRCKIGTCKKEARESKYWLRMIASAEESMKDAARPLWVEAKELHLIFAKIYRS